MLYTPEECGIEPGDDGIVRVARSPEEVFRPETMASFNGKPIIDEHPEDLQKGVDTTNWRELAVGTVLNVRRGTGAQDDILLADFLVCTEEAIRLVLSGKREVSCGYDSKYFQTAPGEGYQANIIGNHVALVESGRCGARCSIGDRNSLGAKSMTKLEQWKKKIADAFKSKDETELKNTLDNMPAGLKVVDEEMPSGPSGSGPAIHIHAGGAPSTPPGASGDRKWSDEKLDEKFGTLEKSMGDGHKMVMDSLEDIKKKMTPSDDAENKEIEGALEEEAPVGTGDAARKATDSRFLEESFRDTVAKAEIIAPGINIHTFDSAAKPGSSFKAICGLRKKALLLGNNDPATNALIEQANGGRSITADSLEKMGCSGVRGLFNGVSLAKRTSNSAALVNVGDRGRTEPTKVRSTKDINEANKKFYAVS